jgi:hypothetical protein
MTLPKTATASTTVAALCALGVASVASGCVAAPRIETTHVETAPSTSARPWAPPPWSPDFSHTAAPTTAHGSTTAPSPAPDPTRRTQEELIKRYDGAWRAMLAKRNGVGLAEVDKCVTVKREWIDESAPGAWFNVSFEARLDWAKVDSEDRFVVKVDAADPREGRAAAPAGGWLSAAEVTAFAEGSPSTAKLSYVALGRHVMFDSDVAALEALAKLPGQRVPGTKPTYALATKGAARGHIRLFTPVFVSENFCAAWVIDLVTSRSCMASQHSCAEDLGVTDMPPSARAGATYLECAQP